MAEPRPEPVESGAAIEVSFPIARAVQLVREIDLIPRFMLHEGKKRVKDLFGLRETLAAQLAALATEKGFPS